MNFRTCWTPHYISNFGIQLDATILICFLTVLAYHSKVKTLLCKHNFIRRKECGDLALKPGTTPASS